MNLLSFVYSECLWIKEDHESFLSMYLYLESPDKLAVCKKCSHCENCLVKSTLSKNGAQESTRHRDRTFGLDDDLTLRGK